MPAWLIYALLAIAGLSAIVSVTGHTARLFGWL